MAVRSHVSAMRTLRARRGGLCLPFCEEKEVRVLSTVMGTADMPRGPIAGYGKAAEERALMCEDALWYLLQMEGVQQILRSQPQVCLYLMS